MGPTDLFSMLLAGILGILGLTESWVIESKGFACVAAPALLFL